MKEKNRKSNFEIYCDRGRGRTLQSIAAENDLTRERVRQIVAKVDRQVRGIIISQYLGMTLDQMEQEIVVMRNFDSFLRERSPEGYQALISEWMKDRTGGTDLEEVRDDSDYL